MEVAQLIFDPFFMSAILALTEILKYVYRYLEPRLLAVISTVFIAFVAYLSFDYSWMQVLTFATTGLLSASGVYSLIFKTVHKDF
jgi:hypothetical protein